MYLLRELYVWIIGFSGINKKSDNIVTINPHTLCQKLAVHTHPVIVSSSVRIKSLK